MDGANDRPEEQTVYRSISNLSFISELSERIAVNRFNANANPFQLFPVHLSVYR